MITWVFSGVVVLAMALVLISFAADPSLIDDVYSSDSRFAESGLTADQIRSYSLGLALVFGLWALAAAALAVLVMLGRRWARYALIASSVLACAADAGDGGRRPGAAAGHRSPAWPPPYC